MNQEVENHIRNNTTWAKLPNNVRQLIGNSQKEYEKAIVSYCIKNQSRFKDTLVRYVRKDEKKYYEELLKYSKENYMLYPYHLSDIFVRGLRITPFNYYLDMMADLMSVEKSYDTLPNFTAIDCLRLLGIGRNQYIDIINKYRSSSNSAGGGSSSGGGPSGHRGSIFGGLAGVVVGSSAPKRKPVRTLLPTQPVSIPIEPWWVVNVGCVTDDDVKLLSAEEKVIIDVIIDNQKPTTAGTLDFSCVHSLYKKGLVYLDVPLSESDRVELPPLEGFVMNRITGDYFETLLYKLFVSIDERITLGELAALLQIDIDLVINAVSVYCRLAFTKKKNSNANNEKYDASWNDYLNPSASTNSGSSTSRMVSLSGTSGEFVDLLGAENSSSSLKSSEKSAAKTPTLETAPSLISSASLNEIGSSAKRIGFLFDSTLTAFLMMGNLSLGLKNHAVTMFEVGKLSDQMLDSFLAELEKVEEDKLGNEGEARRYFEHAIILKYTIRFLRYNADLTVYSGGSGGGTSNIASQLARSPSFKPSLSVNESKGEQQKEKESDADSSETKTSEIKVITDVNDVENECYEPMGVDLLRCESLASLDDESKQRVLAKNYSVLFSMAPYNSSGDALNSPPITAESPFHVGPALPEMNSPWFRFFLYDLIGSGPPSLLLPKGYRLTNLPNRFKYYDKFMILTWGHDPIISSHSNLLITLNEVSCHGPVLVQCYSESENQNTDICHIAFNDTQHPFFKHPTVVKLHQLLKLEYFSGYISLINPYKETTTTEQPTIDDDPNDWILFDLRFGIPLFDRDLNRRILTLFKENKLGRLNNLTKMLDANRALSLRLIDFIQSYQTLNIMDEDKSAGKQTSQRIEPDEYLIRRFNALSTLKKHSNTTSLVIYPTQCVLFVDGKTSVYTDD